MISKNDKEKAETYLKEQGVIDILFSGDESELPPNTFMLALLHRLIRKRRPRRIIEFGVGFSTLVIAHALYQNLQDENWGAEGVDPAFYGKLWSVETNPFWIENLEQKIPEYLSYFIDIRQTTTEAEIIEGELCHLSRDLPNITPDFVYIDGPHVHDVSSMINGLGFIQEDGRLRSQITADILLYESTLKEGFYMLLAGQTNNMHFLCRHLKRKYRVIWNKSKNYSTFELLERTEDF
ncbi:MAG: class I SAM-dependent methyltransferase [Alphaproteobacteria bacterium]|nr:class I SAM-dependent methyltransferase [Alphaproteobacteria bacterium]